jgi:DNA-binding CsgD family transcriptional regulator
VTVQWSLTAGLLNWIFIPCPLTGGREAEDLDNSLFKLLIGSLRSEAGVNGYCQNLLVGPLQSIGAVGVWIATLTPKTDLQFTAESNVLGLKILGLETPLLEDSPVSAAVRTNKLHSSDTLPGHWLEEQKLPDNIRFSAFPIQREFVVRGAMMLGHVDTPEAQKSLLSLHDILDALTGLCLEISLGGHQRGTKKPSRVIHQLSPRQLSVLHGIRDGFTNYQIARTLNVSESTVKHEAMRIYRFLGTNNRTEAIELSLERGLIALAGSDSLANIESSG